MKTRAKKINIEESAKAALAAINECRLTGNDVMINISNYSLRFVKNEEAVEHGSIATIIRCVYRDNNLKRLEVLDTVCVIKETEKDGTVLTEPMVGQCLTSKIDRILYKAAEAICSKN